MKEFCLLLLFVLLFDPNIIFILLFARDKLLTYWNVVFHGKKCTLLIPTLKIPKDSFAIFARPERYQPGVAIPYILQCGNFNMFINKIASEKKREK